jgi:pre-mRNA-splicing factor ISY1
MARNEEKAQSMLNRWLAYKQDLNGGPKVIKKRPALASECDNINDCERFRMQILKDIGRKIMEIQNG